MPKEKKKEKKRKINQIEQEDLVSEELLLPEELKTKIQEGRRWLEADNTLSYKHILKIFELAQLYKFDDTIDEEIFFKLFLRMANEKEIGIPQLINEIEDYTNMPSGNEKYIFIFQAYYIIDLFSKDENLNSEYQRCMKYLNTNLWSLFEPNTNPNPKPKHFLQKIWELCTGQHCSKEEEKEELKEEVYEEEIHEYDQQYTTLCVTVVLTKKIKNIIELLFYTTCGKYLGKYKIYKSPCFKDIYKINNVFIMQYLNDYDKQCKYLFYLAKKCFEKFKGIENICELFMYIYIHFYLFMFIISLLDSYLRDIPCDSISCRLTVSSIIRGEKDLTTEGGGGLCDKVIFSICEKVKEQLFVIPPSEIIQLEDSEELKLQCYEKYRMFGLSPAIIKKICDYTPLIYIPPEVRTMLDVLFGVITSRGQPSILIHYFQRVKETGIWYKRNSGDLFPLTPLTWFNDHTSEYKLNPELSISKIPYSLQSLIDDKRRINNGQLICDEIKARLQHSLNKVLYASIGCDIDKISEFKRETKKIRRRTGISYDIQQHHNTTESLHELLLIIMLVNGSYCYTIQNSWGETLCSIPITQELFIEYINNGTIRSIYFLLVNMANGTIITGGNKKIKYNTHKLRKKRNRINKTRNKNF
jgi:hypothetical protein